MSLENQGMRRVSETERALQERISQKRRRSLNQGLVTKKRQHRELHMTGGYYN